MRRTIHLCQRGLPAPATCLACREVVPVGVAATQRGGSAICVNRSDWDTIYVNHATLRRCTDPIGERDRLTDRRHAAPTDRGWYWAEWRIPEDGTHDEEKFVAGGPEIVEVWVNDYVAFSEGDQTSDEVLRVSVTGVRESQKLDCFVWLSGKLEGPP